MSKWQVKDLNITADDVLRGQGADPEIIRSRSPQLIGIVEKTLDTVKDLLEPEVFFQEFAVSSFQHSSLELENGYRVTGPIVTGHLSGASRVAVVLCTVGSGIDDYASSVMDDDMLLGMAVEGVGAAAVESLANAVCRKIEAYAEADGMQTTIPLSPGMIGWGVEEGQKTIFDLINPDQCKVSLSPYSLMIPRKSLSMMIGIGPNIGTGESICDHCAMRKTCRYQDQN